MASATNYDLPIVGWLRCARQLPPRIPSARPGGCAAALARAWPRFETRGQTSRRRISGWRMHTMLLPCRYIDRNGSISPGVCVVQADTLRARTSGNGRCQAAVSLATFDRRARLHSAAKWRPAGPRAAGTQQGVPTGLSNEARTTRASGSGRARRNPDPSAKPALGHTTMAAWLVVQGIPKS